ncbi:Beta sliding clamp [Porphyromonas levii]|uniref:DNA polymerase III subunit beta n=1 Tax=Porphyromonas levii TaxID=28114 RepID=UPI001B8D8D50|nr:DNA polymerase III subunit beta [Porphyromonas levii]MBR8729226.1 Beta sliding clamp [Porphyromonas levii]MBR8763455.1 Beta sliding clamp [Porphyromonas levii]MBR8764979.1 Beta sliding clamp [Porphyromonas levii]
MKFTILSDVLRDHLQVVGRVVNSKNTLAIMEFALFEVSGDSLSLTATDGETRIVTRFPLNAKEGEDMSFCVRVRQLLEPLKEIPNQVIEFKLSEDNELEAKYNNGHFSFPVVQGADFPSVESLGDDKLEIKMPVTNFLEGLENTLYATSTDDVRPIMTGVHLDIRPEHITFVGTNGFLLAYYRHSMLDLGVTEPYKITLQRKPAQLLSQVFQKKDDEIVEIELYPNFALFRTPGVELQCRLLEGKYPNYETVIPKENDKTLEADRLQLLAATRRVSVFANKGMDLVSFDFAPTQLTLKASDIDFSTKAEEVLPVSFSSTEARFSFRSEHLIQILGVMPSKEIVMKIGDASRAALISPIESEAGVEIVIAVMPFVYS